jgi:hypothetical protein
MQVGDLVRSVDDNEVGIVAGTKTEGRVGDAVLFRVIFANGTAKWVVAYWLRKFSIEEYEESEAWDKEFEETA